ncbi:MAG TPA: MATE family efflux transporter [Flavobacterium sp.]|uniref:MATE family efflux transporter n=1 Tax=Flavobacterium sp. TaxID=239 RepID=UPI002B4ACB85|nr:MATE family efflux transporter [Flavobacterium sp.]HLO74379.1 MATE family efflux transporter [Flavobacterium sp.]
MILQKILNNLSSQAAQSAIFKGLTGFFMFISISFLVRYLGNTGYGIWVLVFSFFQWGLYFDFGVSNVLKSKIPELISKKKESQINNFIAESIKITVLIALVLLFICVFFIFFFNINTVFNIDLDLFFTKKLFFLNAVFFCINFVLSINKSLYIGVLNPKVSELSSTITQLFFFITIGIVFIFYNSISIEKKLLTITLLNGVNTTFINGVFLYLFFRKNNYKPILFQKFNSHISKEIFNNGIKFMIIQVFMVVIFFSDPYFIASYCSPKDVSVFDILNRLYQLPLLIIISGLASFWPFFSKKFHEKQFLWFKSTFQRFQKIYFIIFICLIFFTILSNYLVQFWVGNEISSYIDINYLILMMFIVLFRIYFTFYANFFNGINRLKSQIVVMGLTAVIKIPLTMFLLKNGFGLYGIFLQLLFFMLLWAVYFKIESSIVINKMINE